MPPRDLGTRGVTLTDARRGMGRDTGNGMITYGRAQDGPLIHQ
jgi:hypothetical protein